MEAKRIAGIRRRRPWAPALLVVASTLVAAPAAAKLTAARRTHGPDLAPPAAQAKAGIEGWALVCVTVQADGTVAEPRVVDAGPTDDFAAPGRAAAEGWKFAPGRLDGEPVATHDVCDLQLFRLGASAAAERAETKKALEEAERRMDAEELDAARDVLDRLAREGPLPLRQGAQRELLVHRVALAAKQPEEARDALDRAVVGGGRFLSDDERVAALGTQFVVLVDARRYREAADLFERFQTIPGGAQPMVLHGDTAAKIRELATDGGSFLVPGRLEPALAGDGGVWRHRPLRREIGVRAVEGTLEAFVFECELRKERLGYQEDVSWSIPESWGACTIWAEGTPGTTFELIEYGVTPPSTGRSSS